MAYHVREWFDTLDKDGNGFVDSKELQTAMVNGNLHFSLSTIAHMIRIFSKERKAQLNFNEFKEFHGFLVQIQTSFQAADTNHDGQLSFNEVAKILKDAGYRLDREVFSRLMEVFDLDGNRSVDLTAFIRLTMILRGAKKAFEAFDPYQSGQICLDFNQLLYITTNLV